MLLEKLDERGMPRDLIYLAMIESGFEPNAYSHAGGVGAVAVHPGDGEALRPGDRPGGG
jgi:membrane-bound lytic murein transglycosylase D